MQEIYRELVEQRNVRSNLSALRAELRKGTEEEWRQTRQFVEAHEADFFGFLNHEDAKTRKNAALLLGDLEYERAADILFDTYQKEQTLFVKSAYLEALSKMDVEQKVPELKACLESLMAQEISEENRKHVSEEIRMLHAVLMQYEEMMHHTFDERQQKNRVILTAVKNCRETVQKQVGGKLHPLGVLIETDDLTALQQVRTFREMLFPVPVKGLLPSNPKEAAQAVWKPMLALCRKYHREPEPFYFRIECKAKLTLEERSAFTKRLGAYMEQMSGGALVNSVSDYEVELRLVMDRSGAFFPCLKFYTWKDRRFSYRKNAVATSVHPSTAALIMELAAPYLKENAQIMDPFCGVGTLLIERDIRVPAREKYGTDIFGSAIEGARENASLAGENIHFIHRDFMDFRHEYPFDEIVTDMPGRGKMSREEVDKLYEEFFRKAPDILAEEAVIIMYTGELGFVKKQLRLHKEYTLLQEYCMQSKRQQYLLIIRVEKGRR